ncbi:MAG TPA: DivIVA domain-containing protein [Pseudonocardiaceae bacterium]
MALTPAQVHSVAFSGPPIAKRGYHKDEVNAFLDVVETELARLLEENVALGNQLAHYDQQPNPGAIETAAGRPQPVFPPTRQPLSAGADAYHHAAKVLNQAQQTADRMTSQAKAEADALLSQARANAERLLRETQSGAEGLVSEAATQAETVIHDARTRAAAVEQQSRDNVAKIVSQQQEQLRQHTDIITTLGVDKVALQHKIERLRLFEDDDYNHVTRFLHAQLQQLVAQKSDGPADPISAQQGPAAGGSDAHPETSWPWSSSQKRALRL